MAAYGLFFALYFGIPLGIVLLYCIFRVWIIEKGTALVVERWGRFHRCCYSGWHFLVPFADRPRGVTWRVSEIDKKMTVCACVCRGRRVSHGVAHRCRRQRISQTVVTRLDLRENVMDFPTQSIITRDNVEIHVHPMLLMRLVDPVRVCYETFDLTHAVEKLVQTTLRSIIGDMGLDDTLASREEIERGLKVRINNVCKNWGLNIFSVELLEITPARTVQEAMHKQLAAERIRRAAIVTAEGFREQTKTEAEGAMQAQIALAGGEQRVAVLRAKGTADARLLIAKAEASAITIIASALREYGVNASQYNIALKYITAFEAIASQASNRTLYFPYEVRARCRPLARSLVAQCAHCVLTVVCLRTSFFVVVIGARPTFSDPWESSWASQLPHACHFKYAPLEPAQKMTSILKAHIHNLRRFSIDCWPYC